MIGMSAATGRRLGGIDHLRQSVKDILTTRVGTRPMRRDYGSELPALVDRPVNGALLVDVYAATAKALRRWEPRMTLTRVAVSDVRPGRLTLTLEAIYRPTGQPVTLDGIVVE